MSRSGKPPQPVVGGLCVCKDGKEAMDNGIFCPEHELLWIAHAGCTSNKLKRKHKKLWAQFARDYRVKDIDINRIIATWRTHVFPATLRSSSEALSRGAAEHDSIQHAGSYTGAEGTCARQLPVAPSDVPEEGQSQVQRTAVHRGRQ